MFFKNHGKYVVVDMSWLECHENLKKSRKGLEDKGGCDSLVSKQKLASREQNS